MGHSTRVLAALALALLLGADLTAPHSARAAEGQLVIGVHVTVAPRWLDPAETESAISPFLVLYALHDALVKPMPAGPQTPSLAESWTARPTASPTTSCCGTAQVPQRRSRHRRGREVLLRALSRRRRQAPEGKGQGGPGRRPAARALRLKEPWPDFMTFYGTTATGSGWIVPEEIRGARRRGRLQEGARRRRAYKFVSFTPGVELVLEAFDGYWRKAPQRQAPGAPQHSRRDHARGGAQARRRGRRLLLRRAGRRGHPPHLGAEAHHPAHQHRLLPRLHRSVGAQVAVGRPAGAPGREPGR